MLVMDSQKATLTAKGEVKKQCKILGVPVPTRGGIRGISKITVRFVRIRLSTGETEVLVTSLSTSGEIL
jgi:hypothetical protein